MNDRVATAPAWFERLATVLPAQTESPFGGDTRPRQPTDGSVGYSAVLILFGPDGAAGVHRAAGDDGADVLLTQRAATMRSHAGQVAFPGGRLDPQDAGPQAAALREAVEETGLDPAGVQIRGTGPALYLPPSNFLVTPVLAWWQAPSPVAPGDPAEVSRVVRVPVAQLVDPANRFQAVHPSGFASPGFAVAGLFVWGFTAGLLSWLITLAGLEQPWDQGRRRPVQASGPLVGDLDEQVIE